MAMPSLVRAYAASRHGWLALPVVLSLAAQPLQGQTGEITWPRVSVEARLDSAGRLHVREVDVMRFTGDWNGGERTFDVRHGQSFGLHRMTRLDTTSGTWLPMKQGDLDVVDGFDFTNGATLRWRGRLPDDPPFNGDVRTYQFEYVFSELLVPSETDSTRYTLDHDFGFADRVGNIDRFTLYLTFDPAWDVPPAFESRFARDAMPPGEGFVVTLPLRYLLPGRPGGVDFGASRRLRYGLVLLMLVPTLPLAVRLARRERALGRFAPLVPPGEVSAAWLEANVFHLMPEVVGAAWDDSTGEAEVAATIARLVQEGKLKSTVSSKGRGIFSKDVLGLELLVDRGQLGGHERALIDGLFIGGSTTDTERVRKHYKRTGFDPAALIRKPLAVIVDATPGVGTTLAKPSRWPALVLLLTGVVSLVVSVVTRPKDAPIAFAGIAILFVAYIISLIGAAVWQRRVSGLARGALWFVVPLSAVTAALATYVLRNPHRAGAVTLVALALVWLAFTVSVLNQAMSRQSAERIALRKRLGAAREFFRRELKRAQPTLDDKWFAYLIAFGLGRHIDKWFRAFGGESARHLSHVGASTGSSRSSSGHSWTGFGGGGGFSGGGSSASFAAAVGGMASSVPSPSSSSSGGGGGGGGSSGGGGGGGW